MFDQTRLSERDLTETDETPAAAKSSRTNAALKKALAALGTDIRFERNTEVFGEGEPPEFLYQVVSGAVRTYKILDDGRRQIGAFLLPGDVFGLEAGESRGLGAEAIVRSTLRVAKRSALLAMAARNHELSVSLWASATEGLRAAQDHLMVLGRKNAEERVATFLLNIAGREKLGDMIQLPMSRQDIADYLGLTIETISRTLTQFASDATIALPSAREVVLRSRSRLQRLNA